MYVRMQLFNGGTGDREDLVSKGEISFPWAEDEAGNVILVMMYKPGEWMNIWEREMLIDGSPHKVRLSVMEVSYGSQEVSETSVSGSDTPASSGVEPESSS